MFSPTKAAARNALDAFLPKSGSDYAANRNYDNGPDGEASVSRLSPWVRTRLLSEWEIVSAVLGRQSASAASKFIDEVCWRTYWKGWLQLRPSVWDRYLSDHNALLDDFRKNVGYREAIEGRTGIDCFDAWNTELIANNYLHNHARMWYASIWIHTLKLPWQLGAGWFLRHLLDGDPASNTLSWRWVAGLHTRGKTYLARGGNIRKYTRNRFEVNRPLADEAVGLEEAALPQPGELPATRGIPQDRRIGLLVTDEDTSASDWLAEHGGFVERASIIDAHGYQSLGIAPAVVDFRRQVLSNSVRGPLLDTAERVAAWARDNRLDGIAMADPKAGSDRATFDQIKHALSGSGIQLHTARHWWDDTLYPHATQGFFRFKQAIPHVLDRLGRTSDRQAAS